MSRWDELRGAAEKATPGPWDIVASYPDGPMIVGTRQDGASLADVHDTYGRDAEFIALADPQTILSLLDRIEELEQAVNG